MTDHPLLYLAAFLLGVVAVGRATRLVTSDAYPPMAWWRDKWDNLTANRGYTWQPLFTCPFCFAPYAAAIDLAWVAVAGVEPDGFWSWAWWLTNIWAAGSYLAAIVVVYDEPAEE